MTGDPRYPIECFTNFIINNYFIPTYETAFIQPDGKIVDKQQNLLEFAIEEFIQFLRRDLAPSSHIVHFSLPGRHVDSYFRTLMTPIDVLSRLP
ncbi:hypothetical protein WK43_22490 [Burkholderia ubonensis]|nr:hypothetical protein WM29_08745 [Burkholderia ubonensis]KVS37913.1 hypothetical protein WK37_28710 [Burkholderia ubonensis]KVS50276.1 hypothetical protein WK38_15450 [Burkholderia ubonensis]KVS70242.1 hypothetical protein WK42_28230 [Burkholderia ubonensis]KVS85427.1 hypothetical protein WK43_22490 [Burkholderia ubonensis]